MRKLSILTALVVVALTGLSSLTADARPLPVYQHGYDISFPQCQIRLPKPSRFAIVGVNDGMPGTRNPCLGRELSWARRSIAVGGTSAVSLYVNSNNPGSGGRGWPRTNVDPISRYPVPDRFGVCVGHDGLACAWQYGWNRAEYDAQRSGIRHPLRYDWWLDVETSNTWQSDRQKNRAVLTGMSDYFESLGVVVGVYSTPLQWSEIAGPVSSMSPLFTLPEWLTGSGTKDQAESTCTRDRLTAAGQVMLSQWFTLNAKFDGDVTCPQTHFRRLRIPS